MILICYEEIANRKEKRSLQRSKSLGNGEKRKEKGNAAFHGVRGNTLLHTEFWLWGTVL